MFAFTGSRKWFEYSGLAIFLGQLSLFAFILEPFHYGTWYQVEPVTLALFVLAACNGLWLAAGFLKGWLVCYRPLHPLLLCLGIWVSWQWLATALAPLPWRAWFGHPAVGEGTAYYTALLMSCLLAYPLWEKGRYRNIIMAVAGFNLLALGYVYFDPLILFGVEGRLVGQWASYIAFPVGYLWVVFMATPSVRTKPRYGVFVLVTMLLLFGVAGNKSADVLFEAALIVGAALLWLHLRYRPRWLRPGRGWKMAAMAGCLLPLSWIVISQGSGWGATAERSMSMRALFNQVSVATVMHEPSRLLIGHGWGRYVDDAFKYALVDGVHTFHDGARAPNWSIIDGHVFHPHNEPMETLLALGLPGMLLWLALPLLALWYLPPRLFWWCAPILLAVVALQSFWFFMPQVLAYQALSWVALSVAWRPTQRRMVPVRWAGGVCVVIAAMMLFSAVGQWQGMAYGERLSKSMVDAPYEEFSVDWLMQDMPRGGDRFRSAADFYTKWSGQRIARHELDARDTGWYSLLMQAAHRMALAPQSDAWQASTDMWLQSHLFEHADRSLLDSLKPQARDTLTQSVIALSAKAPLREDITAGFLYSLGDFTGGDAARETAILQEVLAVAPEHRAALWGMGQGLLRTSGHEEEGRVMLRRAVDAGLERVYPVTRQEIEAVVPAHY